MADAFGAMISAALRDNAAKKHLPRGFADRFSAPRRRWLKVAASIAAMASFVAFAAYFGVVAVSHDDVEGNAPSAESSDVEIKVQDELDVLTGKGGNTMIARKMAGVVGAAVVSVAVSAAELTSEPTLVFTRPETSSFWNTATNNVMTVPIDFPSSATVATLSVRGLGYNAVYANIEKGTDSYTFTLPPAVSQQTENVYDLALSFDDGTERTAKLGLIDGYSPNAEGTALCLAPSGSKVWQRVNGSAVLPIPYGTTSFSVTVNGERRDADTGLNGSQGWYALDVKPGDKVSLSMIAGGLSYSAALSGPLGVMLIVE